MEQTITCPQCGQSDQVEKVSTIYLTGLEKRHSRFAKGKAQEKDTLKINLAPRDLEHLSQWLAPPSSGAGRVTRPVHPDWVLLAMTAILPVFIAGIWNSQRGALIPVLAVMALFYGLYFLRRRVLIERYQNELEAQQNQKERIERGIRTWMKLYYCHREGIIFLPGRKEFIPVDQIDTFLSSKEI